MERSFSFTRMLRSHDGSNRGRYEHFRRRHAAAIPPTTFHRGKRRRILETGATVKGMRLFRPTRHNAEVERWAGANNVTATSVLGVAARKFLGLTSWQLLHLPRRVAVWHSPDNNCRLDTENPERRPPMQNQSRGGVEIKVPGKPW